MDRIQPKGFPGLEEDDMRKLLKSTSAGSHRCLWRKTRVCQWEMEARTDYNVFVGYLDTFIETRSISYSTAEGKDAYSRSFKDKHVDVWGIEVSQPPPFVRRTSSLVLEQGHLDCEECRGRGEIACCKCDRKGRCRNCKGRGRIDRETPYELRTDGYMPGEEYSRCDDCRGSGKCSVCKGTTTIGCRSCGSTGSITHTKTLVVEWRTLQVKKFYDEHTCGFHKTYFKAQGYDLHDQQGPGTCKPAAAPNLSRFSSQVLDGRSVPSSALVRYERHQLLRVPVARMRMVRKGKSFEFCILGHNKLVKFKTYPCFCSWLSSLFS